ncbi:MAG TPA: DUF5675 family protein [Fibrobacteria bacterium]|nr:DUF5675 family protein [Fibrobacteria bacterium]
MRITVIRTHYTEQSTSGVMLLDGNFFGYTLEDATRTGPKVPGKTAIPAGRYKVNITHSPRFGKMLPLLLDVPGFTGVRIHGGNTADNTEGCILVAQRRIHADRIGGSLSAALVALLQAAGGIHDIQIIDAWEGGPCA